MNILITGGAGFIGSHTADALIRKGCTVRILDNLQRTVHPKGKPDYLNPNAEFILGDVRDKQAFKQALDGMDAVYHLAAYQDYLPDFSTFFHVNAVSTALLFEIIVEDRLETRIQKVVVASSQAVMGEGRYICANCHGEDDTYLYPDIRVEAQLKTGDWNHRCPDCREILQWRPSDETVAHPCNQYALSKYSQEQIAIQMGKRYKIPSVVMRYSIVQGPRQSLYNAYSGAMRIFSMALMFDRQPMIFEDGQQIRDFVNIEDVVAANLLVLEQRESDYQVFNVGGGIPYTVNDFYETLQSIAGKRIDPAIARFYRYGDTRHIVSDIGKLKHMGWAPKHTILESITDYWAYLQQAEQKEELFDFAQQHMKDLNVIREIG